MNNNTKINFSIYMINLKIIKKALYLIIFFLFINLGNIIDITQKPIISDIIVALGGGKEYRIKKGLYLYRHNFSLSNKIILPNKKYTKLVLSNDFFSVFLTENKIDSINIINLDGVSNTMEELIAVKKYLIENNMHKVTFISHPTHSLRIKLLANIIAEYKKDNIQVNIVSADHTEAWNKQYYFLEWESFKLVFLELLKIAYNFLKYCFFLQLPKF